MFGRLTRLSGTRRTLVDYAITIVLAVGLALLIQAFVVKPYMIPSPSMANTLVPGQRVLVDRLTYHYRDIARGDVIVFKQPHGQPGKDILIKRVVGLPGDTLSLDSGRLYVNGKLQNEPYVRVVGGQVEPTDPADTFGGPASAGWSLATPYTLPAGQYFVMGDNRTNSGDSRYFGTVPEENVIGRAFFSYWPPGRLGTL
jgi:signal peptidase I